MISDQVASSVSSAYTKSFTYYFEGQKGTLSSDYLFQKVQFTMGFQLRFVYG